MARRRSILRVSTWWRRWLLSLVALTVVAAGCGGDAEPELTIEQRLAAVEGRTLTASELAERLEIGAALCAMNDQVLDAVWQRLDDEQLAFQDVVFGHICPDRSVLYAGHTGRYVTEEAESSGVSTSTTRPTTTTTTTTVTAPAVTTAPRATIGPAPSPTEPDGTEETVGSEILPDSTAPTSAPATSSAVVTPSTEEGEGG